MTGEGQVSLGFEGESLIGVVRSPNDATAAIALLLHGGPGGVKDGPSNLYIRLSESLARAGIASARFDFLGSNESSGDYIRTSAGHQVAQYRHIVNWLRTQGYAQLAVVGESFGGTCALGGYAAADVDVLVLLWPAIWLIDTAFAPFVTPEQQAVAHERGFIDIEGTHVGPGFIEDLRSHPDRETELAKVTAPTLLIHGDADIEVPVDQSERAFQRLREPKRLVVVPHGEHCLRRPEEQALVIKETTEWLALHLTESPTATFR